MLIQEQMKKGGSSSNLWALRQLADFMATHGSPAALPVPPSSKIQLTEGDLSCFLSVFIVMKQPASLFPTSPGLIGLYGD